VRSHFKVAAWVLLGLAVFVSAVIFGLMTPFTPPAPPSWHQVHIGMQRSNILQLVGASRPGMYPEKPCDVWWQEGALGSRRLFVWYDYKTDTATMVREFVWWRPSRRVIDTRMER
jgi:hypothetical protein